MHALLPAVSTDIMAQALSWVHLSAEERHRRAAAAATTHDAAALLALADTYLTLHGAAGARVSAHYTFYIWKIIEGVAFLP